MKRLAAAFILLASASISFGQAVGGNGVPGASTGGSGTVNSGTGEHITYYSTTGTAVSSDANLDDGLTQSGYLTYSGSGGIKSTGTLAAGGNLVGTSNGSEITLGTNFVEYVGYGNGIVAMLNGSSAELTRLNFGTNTSGSVALCPSTTTLTVCGGDGSAVGTLVAPVVQSGNGFTGTKTAGSCVLTIAAGIITNVTGC